MKRVREEEEHRWKKPGYLGFLSWDYEDAQDAEIQNKTKLSTYYISERRDTEEIVVSYPINENSSYLLCRTWESWEETVVFIQELCSEHPNFVPLKRQDSIVFRPIYAEIKEAIRTWTLCARRLGFPRDVRQLISEMLYCRPWEWKN